jgi:hypothetical protein
MAWSPPGYVSTAAEVAWLRAAPSAAAGRPRTAPESDGFRPGRA